MRTRRWTSIAVTLLLAASAASAARAGAQGSPGTRPADALRAPRIAHDSARARGLRWTLPPLVDGARAVVVPVLPAKPAAYRTQPVDASASAPVEYMMRVVVPDTARMAPMPVMRPALRP